MKSQGAVRRGHYERPGRGAGTEASAGAASDGCADSRLSEGEVVRGGFAPVVALDGVVDLTLEDTPEVAVRKAARGLSTRSAGGEAARSPLEGPRRKPSAAQCYQVLPTEFNDVWEVSTSKLGGVVVSPVRKASRVSSSSRKPVRGARQTVSSRQAHAAPPSSTSDPHAYRHSLLYTRGCVWRRGVVARYRLMRYPSQAGNMMLLALVPQKRGLMSWGSAARRK